MVWRPEVPHPLSKSQSEPADEADTRMPPDPFAAVLPALAALGAITSIAAINWSGEGKLATRARTKRKTAAALRDLETCCLGLAEIFRRFQRHPRVFAGEGGQAAAPLKFGVHGQRIRADAQRLYLQLMNDIASMLVLAAQNAFDVMTAIEDGDIDAPEEIFFAFGEQQDRLNTVLQSRVTLRVAVDTGADVAERLVTLVRELKTYQKPA
ncbi:hypothetical protein HYPDE_39518 [Hyphomicrobium denitrificans 1NES1]|uniref:Uncharacterized protein n=1 Tax=Hyphomicrobium denitrificans 1NES1 TaxID=670307 RepID=N0BBF5_9HYPH|nr:hypothetical protein HYPDE_39518 [Hyphomicrobium denitrificans 1NES1]